MPLGYQAQGDNDQARFETRWSDSTVSQSELDHWSLPWVRARAEYVDTELSPPDADSLSENAEFAWRVEVVWCLWDAARGYRHCYYKVRANVIILRFFKSLLH